MTRSATPVVLQQQPPASPRKKNKDADAAAAAAREIAQCRALVVDSNQLSRSILAAQLRDLGVGTVVQCMHARDARKHLENRSFDVVLCEHNFEGPAARYSGQDLLDDLRRHNLLPYSTVFFMVTAEATYAKVAEAAESALDSYLLKPYSGSTLGQRLDEARRRKRVLKDIFDAVEKEDFETAAKLCLQRFTARAEYWLFAARIGAELLLRLGLHEQARQMYEAVTQAKTLPWAKLGIARAQIGAGDHGQAMRTLDALIQGDPGFGDAYDVMGRLQMEQGHIAEALATYSKAAELTPGSIARAQKQGTLAFYAGEIELSARSLERAVTLGLNSRMFDHQTLALLAFCRFRTKDQAGLRRCAEALAEAMEKNSGNLRLQRIVHVVGLLNLMAARQVAALVTGVRDLVAEARDPAFDVEAACNAITLLSEIAAAELRLDFVESCIEQLALRFVTTKGVGELVVRAANAYAPYQELIRQAQGKVTDLAEQAMAHSLAGDPRSTVVMLMDQGEQTLNTKLVDVATMVLTRHHQRIPDAPQLQARLAEFRRLFAGSAQLPKLGDEGGRQAGGLSLRAGRRTEADVKAKAEARPEAGEAVPSH